MSQSVHIIGVQFSSFVRAVQFCCEEIGIDYQLGTRLGELDYSIRSPALKSLNPFGKVPVLVHEGRALFETQAICRYLDNQWNQARLQPADPFLRAQVDQWCAAISLYVDKAIVRNYLLEFLLPKGENGSVRTEVAAAAMPEIIAVVALLEQQLAERDYLVGDSFTLADIMLAPILHYLAGAPHNADLLSQQSPLRRYLQRLLARPAAAKVLVVPVLNTIG